MSAAEFSLFLVSKNLIDRSNKAFEARMGWADSDLFRRPMSFLVPADAHDRVDKLLAQEDDLLTRVVFPRVPLRVRSGGFINFDMKIECLEDERRRLDFFRPGNVEPEEVAGEGATDMHSFFNFVEMLVNSPYDGDLDLTLVSVEALYPGSVEGLTDEQRAEVQREVEANLERVAVGGQVGRLDDASFGLLTAGDFDEEAFQQELAKVAQRINVSPELLGARSANVKVDDRDIDPRKLRQALNHSRGVFLGEIDGDEELDSLSGVIDGIEHNRRLIQNALREFKFLSSPRLISDNVKSVSVARLQQGKISLERRIRRPDEIVVLADHPDIALQHDLLQLERLIKARTVKSTFEREKTDFYDLCRSAMVQEDFAQGLKEIVQRYGEQPAFIGFRVKGLPPVKAGGAHWQALNELSDMGHPLWIDRFGDAVIEPEALACLKGGFIEMPPLLMKKLADHFDGKDLMIKLIATWQNMDVRVVSADLPDYNMKTLAQNLGIVFAVEDPPEDLDEQ